MSIGTDYDVFGVVYFLQRSDGLIKIGYTNNPRRRYSQLEKQYGEKLELLTEVRSSVPKKLESIAHRMFRGALVEGEWFVLNMQEIIGFSLIYDIWGYASTDRTRGILL